MSGTVELWAIIVALGIGSFGLRFVFLGLVGDRALPAWLLRHLRYTAVAIIPALVMPLVVWPSATGGDPDPIRFTAAAVTFAIGYLTKSIFFAMGIGGATLMALSATF